MSEVLNFRKRKFDFEQIRTFKSKPDKKYATVETVECFIRCDIATKSGLCCQYKVPVYDYINYKRNTLKDATFICATKPDFNTSIILTDEIITQMKLKDYQIDTLKSIIDNLHHNRVAICNLATGKGKTVTSLAIVKTLPHMNVLVLVNKIILVKQWQKELLNQNINNVTVLTCQYLTNNILDKYYHFVIFDELNEMFTKNRIVTYLQKINSPYYTLGLSATPSRMDHIDGAIKLFFGDIPSASFNISFKSLDITIVTTGLNMLTSDCFNRLGELSFTKYMQNVVENETRNMCITNIVYNLLLRKRVVLVIISRVSHGKNLKRLLLEKVGCSYKVDDFMESKNSFDETSDVLIATLSKVKSGFNWPILNTLVLTTTIKKELNILQTIGRVTRRSDVEAEIYDLFDSDNCVKSHQKNREDVYRKSCATIHTKSMQHFNK